MLKIEYKVLTDALTSNLDKALEKHVLKDIVEVRPSKYYVYAIDSKGRVFQLPLYRCLKMRIINDD